ncbi:MAG: hypothetical protein KAW47_10915 [Thermoplasmatales archaeon]|nr:hypothetical protein [Thermoplasmatales archaeon]
MEIPEYQDAKDLIMMVIKRKAPATILVSKGGLGKSYLAKTLVEEYCPNDYEYRTGHITPLALYQLFYDNRDKTVILDDVEEVFGNDIAVGILKPALWAVKGKREITWASTSQKLGDYPQKFDFTGGIILLANKIPRESNPVVKALKSRALVLEITLTYTQKLRIMKAILDNEKFYSLIGTELNKKDRSKLKADLEKHTSLVTKNFNFRTMEKLVMFYVYGREYHSQNLNRHIELHNATNSIDEDKAIVLEIMLKKLTVQQQIEQFKAKTGKSRATYYRIKKDLELELKDVSKSHEKPQRDMRRKALKLPSLGPNTRQGAPVSIGGA